MNIVILGAGEVGRELAWSLAERHNNVTLVDHSAGLLERLRDRLDVMTVQGECATVEVLKAANVAKAGLLIAAAGSDTANILACRITHHFGVPKIVCRLTGTGYFSEADGLPPASGALVSSAGPSRTCAATASAWIPPCWEGWSCTRSSCFSCRPSTADRC